MYVNHNNYYRALFLGGEGGGLGNPQFMINLNKEGGSVYLDLDRGLSIGRGIEHVI